MSEKKLVFKYKDKDYLYRTVLYNKSTRRRSLFVAAIISWKEKSIDHENGALWLADAACQLRHLRWARTT